MDTMQRIHSCDTCTSAMTPEMSLLGGTGKNTTYIGSLELSSEHRYYSDAVLGVIHRSMAIREWAKLKEGQPIPLERALAAFDQFVLHDRVGDLGEVRGLRRFSPHMPQQPAHLLPRFPHFSIMLQSRFGTNILAYWK